MNDKTFTRSDHPSPIAPLPNATTTEAASVCPECEGRGYIDQGDGLVSISCECRGRG